MDHDEVRPRLPPFALAARTGGYDGSSEFWTQWDEVGAVQADMINSFLPPGWSTAESLQVLDFGCGSGRTLRHFMDRADRWELWGCDIDGASIEWLSQNLSPPFRFLLLSESPGIPRPDASFDFIYAMSVFTHLVEHWSGWLVELHRVLKSGGLALISFLGRGMIEAYGNEGWDPDRIGMNAIRAGKDWESGGPIVFHSEWWIRAHWGRAFEIVRFEDHEEGHGLVLLKKRDVELGPHELEMPEPGEPRELAALRHNVEQLHVEDRQLRAQLLQAERALEECREVLPSTGHDEPSWSELGQTALQKIRRYLGSFPGSRPRT